MERRPPPSDLSCANGEPADVTRESASLRALRALRSIVVAQKSNSPPSLKNRDCSTLVGRSHWLVASVENVLVTVNGQLLLKML